MKITLVMIVKNEEKYIGMCLENAFKLADNAVIVDTGSTDRTKDIIKEFGDKVTLIEHTWKNDFSEARNVSLENADGDWILFLDADEKLYCDSTKIREILNDTSYDGFLLPLYNIINQYNIVFSSVYCKLYRNKGYRYSGAIHEQLNIGSNTTKMSTEVCRIIHFGYMRSVMKEKDKTKRNLKILRDEYQKDTNNSFVCYNLGITYTILEDYNKALKYLIKSHNLTKGKILEYTPELIRNMALCLYFLKDYNTCINLTEEILQVDYFKKFVDLRFIQGNCFKEIKNIKKAIEAFQMCIELGETREFISNNGLGSFMPKLMLARIYASESRINDSAMQYIEAIFDPNNYMKEGLQEAKAFLNKNNMVEILNELESLTSK